jgi:hypothetical protein
LDFLLASEGGVCGKFNLSNCHLQIDDEGKVIQKITNKMKKLAHVPVQTWKGRRPSDLFRGWFSTLRGFKTDRDNAPCLRGMPGIILPNPPGTSDFQDHYKSHCSCNAMEI